MVRHYVRKSQRGNYSKQTFDEAIEEIKAGHLNTYRASKKYSIPLNTIMNHLKGRRGIKSKSFGRYTAIPIEDEKRLAEDLLKLEKYGFELSRKENRGRRS
jgi:nitroimidazol reductase NimA-like FMN-containing flavoprotein (pyridoxamine 5'-phosphate oxidase superfamily)